MLQITALQMIQLVLHFISFDLQVLQPRSQWVPVGKLENIINELTIDDTSEICKEEEADAESPADDEVDMDAHSIENHRSISTIMQELQKELERPVMEVGKFFSLCSITGLIRSISLCDRIGSHGLIWRVQTMMRIQSRGTMTRITKNRQQIYYRA